IMESVQHVSAAGGSNGSITIAISGGTPGYSIQWYAVGDPGTVLGTSLSLSGLSEGDYRVVVTDNALGGPCSEERTIKITEPGTALGLTEEIEAAGPCHGASNGSIELTASGGAGGYTFTLLRQPATEVTENVEVSGNRALYTGLPAGLYTARVRDANGTLVELLDLEVGQPTPLEVYNITFNNVSCFGANDGSLRFSIRGGTPDGSGDYAYVLVRGNGSKVNGSGHTAIEHVNLVPDDYVLTVYDATNVCFAEERFTITEPADIEILEHIVDVSCFGGNDGSIRIEASGGASDAFNYEWQVEDATTPDTWLTIADSNTEWLQDKVEGTYRVEVRDLGSNCTVVSEKWTIGEPDELTIVADASPVNTCKGDNSGRIEVWVEGGIGPYVVDYGTGTVSGSGPEFFIEDLVADTYTLVVRDRNGTGCQATTTVEIEEPAAALAVSEAEVSISCVADNESFSVEFEISGGVAVDLGGVPVFSYHIEVINLLTSGRRTKELIETADQPVTVHLDDLNLPAGEYRVIVSDLQAASSAACTAVETSFAYKHLNVQNIIGHESCPGAFDGSIDLSVSGGSGDYTYAWTKGGTAMTQTTQDLSGLEAGTYTVTITDVGEPAGRCAYRQTFTVNRTKELLVEGSVQDVSCFDGSNGAIRIHGVANATLPLTYFWNGASEAGSAELTGLTAGSYSVEILDGDGCRVQEYFTIEQPDAPLGATLTSELDCTSDTRSITVAPSDGTGPTYTYQWMGPGAYTRMGDGSTIEGITRGGTWQVEVTDARGCKLVKTIVVHGKVRLSAELTHIKCVGGDGGNIVLDVSGGSGSYAYNWTKDGAPYAVSTKDLNNLEAGKYQVVVTDLSQSCSVGGAYTVESEVFEINEPKPFVVEGNVTDNECYGSAEGTINLHTVTGGTAPYQYVWTTSNGSGLIPGVRNQSGLTAGDYFVRLIDDMGCSSEVFPFEVNELPELSFVLNVENTNCHNKNKIEITNPTGGTGDYLFFWDVLNTPTGTQVLEDLPGGTYTITMAPMLNVLVMTMEPLICMSFTARAPIPISGPRGALMQPPRI
ncbi:MAG: SprB repeat-containing protein, partial [Bacteroidales bacterium]|nr:SprB repeat-containing protein [Bacteroidales bacterium]